MPTDTAVTIYRSAYQAPDFLVKNVKLSFDLDRETTRVCSQFTIISQKAAAQDLVLDGEELELISISVDGITLSTKQFQHTAQGLVIRDICQVPGQERSIEIVNLIHPEKNSKLMGLFVSGENKNLFTQCEAQGFRRITFFPDRPDVMASYEVELRANKLEFPVLLSNGNLIDHGDLPESRHYACWKDPFSKPCYLFALVAGKFECRSEEISTRSGKPVLLQVWSDPGQIDKTGHALEALKQAIRWDEQRFGLELDLERFMIVAVRDFNMGAMENKGLNIFNANYVLAQPNTATDTDYQNITAIVGHEYFHNWTGNRVTCRDWFQLSLKEGLTVLRDQEFSADMLAQGLTTEQAAAARAVKRIDDVQTLRQIQFPEDVGPMAHPIRPESYQEIGNFYTATVYEKGAEVIRMLLTLLGPESFALGITEYFRRHDGQAVTCDDFVSAMESVYTEKNPQKNLNTFRLWYSQAGTPRVTVKLDFNAIQKTCTLRFSQRCEKVGIELQDMQLKKQAFHIPLIIGMLDPQGKEIKLTDHSSVVEARPEGYLIELNADNNSFTFTGINDKPVISIARNFSAPVIIEYDYTDNDLQLLMQYDTDAFNRWEALQTLASRRLLQLAQSQQTHQVLQLDKSIIQIMHSVLVDSKLAPAYRARMLTLPTEAYLAEQLQPIDAIALHQARQFFRETLAHDLKSDWRESYFEYRNSGVYSPDALSAGARSLANLSLGMWALSGDLEAQNQAKKQFEQANNMTDKMAALNVLSDIQSEFLASSLSIFYQQYQHEANVIDKWFSLQASSRHASVADITRLIEHPDFNLSNPNRARAVIFRFCMGNPGAFHSQASTAYTFWAEQVLNLDAINPEVAARLARGLDNWKRHNIPAKNAMEKALQTVINHANLSPNTKEVISKALN